MTLRNNSKTGNMTTINGEITVFLDVVGRRQGDNRILEAIVLVGPKMEVEEFDFGGEKSTYFSFKPAGTDLLFQNKVLVMAMVRTQPDCIRDHRLSSRDSPRQRLAPKSRPCWVLQNALGRISIATRSMDIISISSLIPAADSPD
jgi:hypothetical protein